MSGPAVGGMPEPHAGKPASLGERELLRRALAHQMPASLFAGVNLCDFETASLSELPDLRP